MILKSDFVKVTPRQPEHPDPFWGGAKKARFLLRVIAFASGARLRSPPRTNTAGNSGTSRHYDNEICVGARLSAQAVIGYDE